MRKTNIFFWGAITLFILFILTLSFGAVHIPLESTFKILMGDASSNESWSSIFWNFRFPKSLVAILAGSSLAVCGLLMQTYFQNPLAGPFVLGINSGASLGVAIWVLAYDYLASNFPALKNLGLILFSVSGSLAVLLIILFLSFKFSSKVIILVFGLLFSYLASGIINILVSFSSSWEIKTFLLWGFGSFQRVEPSQLNLFVIISIVGLFLCYLLSKPLNALLLGDHYGQSLGINLKRIRLYIISLVAVLAGLVTAFCGPIAFVGVIIPHLCRLLFKTSDHRILIPGCIFFGASSALFAELLSSVGKAFPINSILGLLGAPLLVLFMLKSSRREVL